MYVCVRGQKEVNVLAVRGVCRAKGWGGDVASPCPPKSEKCVFNLFYFAQLLKEHHSHYFQFLHLLQ